MLIKIPGNQFGAVFAIVAFGIVGCGTFEPLPLGEVPFRDRALTQHEENVRVSTVVLSDEESEQLFDNDLYRRGIQPVWLEIENKDESPIYFLAAGLDPDYFAPLEVAYIHRLRFAKYANEQMDQHFYNLAIGRYIGPGATESGFVYTHLEHGTKVFNIDIVGEDHDFRSFTFFVPVPGLEPDYDAVDFRNLYPPEAIVDHDINGLRQALEELPCCVTDADGSDSGQPLNVVLIGKGEDLLYSLVRSGWDATGQITGSSKKSKAIRGTEERYRPVSTRYSFGRAQDASFRKSRHGIHPRNHLRLWRAPLTLDGVPVWIGNAGRDFARRSASADHASDADNARNNLTQNLLYAQVLKTMGYVRRLTGSLEPARRETLTGAPYYADGFRSVLIVSSDPVSLDEVGNLTWDVPVWK